MALLSLTSAVGACGGGSGASVPTLTWYINPDDGGQAELAARCSEASGGRYRVTTSLLPNSASAQREQLVRRLAAKDASIDLISIDPPFLPEFAEAGFVRPFTRAEEGDFTEGVLEGPAESARWQGRLYAAPFWANTQLLWYRKSVASRAGVDPARSPVTWDRLIEAAAGAGKTFEVQGNRYEGYMVLVNALVASAGGEVLANPEAGRDVRPAIDSPAGRRAAGIIRTLARSKAANPAISTSDEEIARAGFQSDTGGFMVNWPYVYKAAQSAVEDGELDQAVVDDIAWARYPPVDEGKESAPPLGGIHIGVGAYGKHQDLAVDAIRCITTPENGAYYMATNGNPGAKAAVFDDPEVRKVFPMADLIRDSINDAGPRPPSPYYTDVSSAVQREFHPPASADPSRSPAGAARLIVDVLNDKVLL